MLTALLLLTCLVFARLFLAPVNVGFARDVVLERVGAVLPGWQVDFDDAVIGWDWRSVRPWVEIDDLELIDRRNRLTALFPHARLGVSFTSVLSGISFSTVDLVNANIVVSDLGGFSDATDKGLFSDLFSNNGMPRPEALRVVTEAFSRFGTRLLVASPGLDQITVTNAVVDLYRGDQLDAARITLPSFRLRHQNDALALAAVVETYLGDLPTQVRLNGSARPYLGEIDLTLGFSGLSPAALARQADMPEIMNYMQFPVGLDLQLQLTSDMGLTGARFTLNVDDGVLSDARAYPVPAPIQYGTISGDYNVADKVLAIHQIEVAAGPQLITGDGLVYWEEGQDQPGVRLFLGIREARVSEMLKYWPIAYREDGSEKGARFWIRTHMKDGLTENARFLVDIRPDGTGPFTNGSPISLEFDFKKIDTLFLLSMPPIVGASGRASLSLSTFRMALSGGQLLDMPVSGTALNMTDIDVKDGAQGVFDVHVAGPVKNVMELISYPPLNVPEKMGFDVARLDGMADVSARLSLPLVRDLAKEDVHYQVRAALTGTKVADLLGGEGLTDGDLSLTVDPDLLYVEGTGKLNGVPMALSWREDLAAGRDDPGADTSRIVMAATLDQTDLLALGVDIRSFLQGQAVAEATFIGRALKLLTGYFSADLLGAGFQVPQLGWRKHPDAPLNLTGTLTFADTGTSLAPLVANGEGIAGQAGFYWGPKDSGSFSGDFNFSELGRNLMLSGTIRQDAGVPLVANLQADQFDLAPLMVRRDVPTAPSGEKEGGNFSLNLDAGRLLLENEVALEQAKIDIDFAGGAPEKAEISGQFADGESPTRLVVAKAETGPNTIHLDSADGGLLLRGLGLFAHLSGGKLVLDGTTAGWGDDLALHARASITGAVLVSKASLGEGVTEGTVSGLDDYLADGPLNLSNIEIPFDYENGLLDLNRLKANGPTLGMTMEGQIEANNGRINVNGVIVPAYGLNSLLGKIPLVGGIFSGGDGKGLFGVTYRIKGQTAAPEVAVNAMSGLAPGFLRLLFEGKKGKVSDVEKAPEPEADAPAGAEQPGEPKAEALAPSY